MSYNSKFVRYYEKLGWNNYQLSFYNRLKKFLPKKKFNYIDIACGTGELAIKVAQLKHAKVEAFDVSTAMIKLAKSKSKNVNFFISDMVNFKNEKYYNVATCLYDSINCLKGLNVWRVFFKNVFFSLKDNGIFIFDYNNLNSIKNWQKRHINYAEKYKIIQKGRRIKDGVILSLKISFNNKDIIDEEFVNYTYEDKKIKNILKETGFKIIKKEQNKLKTRNTLFLKKIN